MAAPRVVVFDAIETLFSLDPLRAPLRAAELPEAALDTWFVHLLRDAFALTAADGYAPFRPLAEGALRSVLADHDLHGHRRARQRALRRVQPVADPRAAAIVITRGPRPAHAALR